MQPILVVYAGYSLDGEHVSPGENLAPYVQDAVNEIQCATGGPNTYWGAQRVADGHPEPFPVHYIEIGNEDFFDKSGSYDGRFAQFYDAIKSYNPKLQLIATTSVTSRTPDVLDEHYYESPTAFENDVHHYDSYSRSGPKGMDRGLQGRRLRNSPRDKRTSILPVDGEQPRGSDCRCQRIPRSGSRRYDRSAASRGRMSDDGTGVTNSFGTRTPTRRHASPSQILTHAQSCPGATI